MWWLILTRDQHKSRIAECIVNYDIQVQCSTQYCTKLHLMKLFVQCASNCMIQYPQNSGCEVAWQNIFCSAIWIFSFTFYEKNFMIHRRNEFHRISKVTNTTTLGPYPQKVILALFLHLLVSIPHGDAPGSLQHKIWENNRSGHGQFQCSMGYIGSSWSHVSSWWGGQPQFWSYCWRLVGRTGRGQWNCLKNVLNTSFLTRTLINHGFENSLLFKRMTWMVGCWGLGQLRDAVKGFP